MDMGLEGQVKYLASFFSFYCVDDTPLVFFITNNVLYTLTNNISPTLANNMFSSS
jgi:hypothetical protein